MRPKTFVAFIGFVMLAVGTYCPLLRPFGIVRWNLFALNKPFGLTILLVAVAGIITVVMNRTAAARAIAWTGLILVGLLYIVAVLRVHSTFRFIPFKGLAGYLTWQIQFSWGWLVLFGGAALSALTTSIGKKPLF
jgi:hypothetical protein